MANSVVKVTDVTDDMISDSLLLLVGEDGTVTPDRSTVENYLNSKSGPTSLQIMHIDKHDPKGIDVIVDNVTYMPDNMEIVNAEDIILKETTEDLNVVAVNLYNIKLDHDYTPLTSPRRVSPVEEEDDELAKTLSILHGNDEPESPGPASSVTAVPRTGSKLNKSINIISSITIPAPGSSAVGSARSAIVVEKVEKEETPAEMAQPAKPKGKAKILHTQPKTAQKKQAQGKKSTKKVTQKEETSGEEESAEEEESDESNEEEEDGEEFEDEDFDLEMEDDDNDSDFDIHEELTGKRTKRGAKAAKPETRRKTRLSESKAPPKTPKTPKTPKAKKVIKDKAIKEDNSEAAKLKTETKVEKKVVDKEKTTEKEPEKPSESKTEEPSVETRQAEVKPEEPKSPDKKLPKKKKEPPKPIPGDFMLFSTPDIIRKVGGKEPTTPGTPEAAPTTPKLLKGPGEQNKSAPKQQPKVDTPTSSKPGKITSETRSKSVGEALLSPNKPSRHSLDDKDRSDKEKHHLRISTESKSSERRDSIEKPKHSKSVDEKSSKVEHVHSQSQERRSSESSLEQKTTESGSARRVSDVGSERRAFDATKSSSKHEHGHSKYDHTPTRHYRESSESQEHIPSAEDIRAIIMNEDTKTYTTNTIPIPDAPVQMTSNLEPTGLNLDASGLDLDQSILDNINSDMISEDILYQVAQQLVSNTELQNAIDKGINEGVLDTSSLQEAMDMSQMSQSSNSSFLENQQSDIIREATQIVRPDGRVVVLPPVERPTTRSRNKRRDTARTNPIKPSFKQPKMDTRSKARTVHKPLDDEHVSGNELDSSDDGEEESEDDPNKLWCICNQPHNNRFMICCDTCEEWYHGKCVNITKAMGQQMESEGKEWICLFCKDSSLKRPMAAARRIRRASRNSRQSTDSNSSAKKGEKDKPASLVPCVVCQKAARKNSIYCSETCILAHAHGIERVVVFDRATGNMLTGSKAPSAANLEQWLKEHPSYEVVRSAGKVVTTKVKAGPLTQSKLKIIKNSNNEGVSLAIQQKGMNLGVLKHAPRHPAQLDQQKQQSQNKSIKVIRIFPKDQTSKESKIKLIQAQPMPQQVRPGQQSTPSKAKITVQTLLAPKLPATPTSKMLKKDPPKKETPKKEAPKEVKQKTPKVKPKEEAQTPQPKQEDIRDNVQKTIFEQLNVRLKVGDIKLSSNEVKDISVEIEAELYKCFGDTGQKYKNKYRSLIFNIKDPKNQTLWRRICEKSISSYELVRLSPDDMASQELAKWREQEAKHQLDMIKKSEIELLNCNRQYVLKTHKGEEVLEDNRPGNKADNTEIIKSLTEGSTLDPGVDDKLQSSKERERDRDKRSNSKHRHKDKRDKDRHSSKDRRDKGKEHKSRKSSSRDRDRSRKRSRSRDKSRHDKKKDKKSRSKSRDRSRERERSRDKERNRERDRHRKSMHKSSRHKKNNSVLSTDNLDKRSKEILEQLNKIAPPVEDRLWKHVPQEDIVPGNAPIDSDSDHEIPSSTVTIPTPPRSHDLDDFQPTSQSSNDSKASVKLKEVIEPEERGLSPPPKDSATQIWSGTINMVDVAQISITAHEVSGDCSGLGKELSENLDIVGRISPDTVWDYIGKMRLSNSKIISLIRLNATNIEEQMPYLALYSYLSSRNRLGVVKSTNKAIKDFYILPLASQKPIPQALLPINGPVKQWLEATVKRINERVQNGFEESRPALLLGIIVRDRRKRTFLDPESPISVHKKTRIEVKVIQTQPARSYTPPPMPPEMAPTPPPPLPPTPKVDPRLAKLTPPPLPPVVQPTPNVPAPPPPMVSPPAIAAIVPSAKATMLPSVIPTPVSPVASPTVTSEKTDVVVLDDDDSPYSPGDSDSDIVITDTVPSPSINKTAAKISGTQSKVVLEAYTPIPGLGDGSLLPSSKLDIQRQMEELNKQIEMQKSEITSITKNIATAGSEIAGSALASIALPSNLQQILDSIKTIGATNSAETEAADKQPPIPGTHQTDLTIPLMIPKTFTRPLSSGSIPDLSSNTIPLNLPNKLKLTPPLVNSPLSETGEKSASVLSSLSEADLIRKAAEMLKDQEASSSSIPPSKSQPSGLPTPKRQKMDIALPPVPGIDD